MPKNAQKNLTDDELLVRLKRVEGQVRGISRMVEERRYCIDVVNQVSAARASLSRVAMQVLQRQLNSYVKSAITEGWGGEAAAELGESLRKLIK